MQFKNWQEFIRNEKEKPYFKTLQSTIEIRRNEVNVFPPPQAVFSAFEQTPLETVKVVILGQDPYHQQGQANGLSFSVNRGVSLPPSLKNMFKELCADIECGMATHGDLTHWAKQGVLLLNTVLTVEEGHANSHKGLGWEKFTDEAIRVLNVQKQPIIFVLWGAHAQKKQKLITNGWHHVLTGVHPSPLSSYRGFFGSKPYSKINKILMTQGQTPIEWELPK